MKPVKCPRCELRWNIDDYAPPVITCPRCLAALSNPFTETQFPGARPPPLPVLPIEHQIARDSRTNSVGLIVLSLIVALGIVVFFISLANGADVSWQGVVGLIVLVAAALIPIVVIVRKKQTVAAAVPTGDFPSQSQPGGMLEYQRPLPDPRKLSPGAFFGQAIGGIILGILGAFFLTALFAQIANGQLSIIGIGSPIVVGAILCTRPRVRGLGVGLILALPAAFLLLLGFCAILIGSSGFH
jgi:hypothetical protein